MPSLENKHLQRWFAPTFKAAGFTKAGATWRRGRPLLIQVFNIQGSQWSRDFYFNLGAYLTDLGDLERPSEFHCHVRERLDAIAPDRARLLAISDFERPCPEEQREQELVAVIRNHAIPWLDRMTSLDQIRLYFLHEKRHGVRITADARGYLGLPRA